MCCPFDLERGEIGFSDGELPLGPGALPLETFPGVPIVTVSAGGRTERFFFDTGAKISYLHSSLARGLRFGTLPKVLELTLLLAGVNGILGLQFCEGSPFVYAPRRQLLSIG